MAQPIQQFGACTLDAAARELRMDGELVTLSPKVFDVLAYLIEHRERAVGRDELIAAVWGRVDVSDTLLGQTVLKARRAIGDDGNEQRAIRTVPRFGYRWVAPIREVAPIVLPSIQPQTPQTADRADGQADPAAHAPALVMTDDALARPNTLPPRRRHRLRLAVIASAFAALALIAAPILLRFSERAGAPSGSLQGSVIVANDSVAVLPVTVVSGEEWAWLRLGLMDLIATRLHQGGQAVVPSDNVVSLIRAGGAGASVVESANVDLGRLVRDATGARHVAFARVMRTAEVWQVKIALLGEDSEQIEVKAEGQDPIETARAASDRLLAVLGKSPPFSVDGTASLSLSELQQRTEAALLTDDFVTARSLIASASPALRDAPVMLLRLAQVDFRSGRLEPARTRLQALLAQTSAEGDPVLRASALYSLGAVALREDRSTDAERAFGEAVALIATRNEPTILGQAYTGLAAAMVNLGRYEEAANNLALARVALQLAGDRLGLARVDGNEGVLDNARGRHAEALPILQRAADTFRRFGALNELFLTVAAQVKAHLAQLDPAAALAASEPVWKQRGQLDNPRSRGALEFQHARALAANGRLTEARSIYENLSRETVSVAQTGLPGDIASERARLYLAAGNARAAVESARDAVARLPTVDEAHERAHAWLTLGRALRAEGRTKDAQSEVAKFALWAGNQAHMPSVTLFAGLAVAEQAHSEHRKDEAYRNYAIAFGDAERWAVPADLAVVAISYGVNLIGDNELERASTVIGRVARWSERDFDCAVLQARLYRALGQRDTWLATIERARTLAGERTIPPSVSDAPKAIVIDAS